MIVYPTGHRFIKYLLNIFFLYFCKHIINFQTIICKSIYQFVHNKKLGRFCRKRIMNSGLYLVSITWYIYLKANFISYWVNSRPCQDHFIIIQRSMDCFRFPTRMLAISKQIGESNSINNLNYQLYCARDSK